ncbi:hypothetical protein RBH29_17330 [Herbivorax sp. ANBcel31]|uniref:hypothetical protein n=1 Tax=Herbivorax sp. ANBcel31 TaxID=3069754 RepID=UPI0027B7540E|nr:hypothetical protein [Herbivorax sp. ANBcel31]MDQ2088188.1 hypothetical protein [Herbivorax sp. ANBcel31]
MRNNYESKKPLNYDPGSDSIKEGSDRYNSNSFILSLLNAADIDFSTPESNLPGWEKPVPEEQFQ